MNGNAKPFVTVMPSSPANLLFKESVCPGALPASLRGTTSLRSPSGELHS